MCEVDEYSNRLPIKRHQSVYGTLHGAGLVTLDGMPWRISGAAQGARSFTHPEGYDEHRVGSLLG